MSGLASARELRVGWLGRVGYVEGWRLQEAVKSRVRAGAPAHLLLLEHDPVYTIGRRGTSANLVAGRSELLAAGASVYRVDRGGDITYHGPGQLVGYPVVPLGEAADLVGYLRAIEGALIATLARYGIEGRGLEGKTGVWVATGPEHFAKIAAIGIRVSRGVATHGFALNVSTALSAFRRMIPCGFAHDVASLEAIGARVALEDVAKHAAVALAARLGLRALWSAVDPARDDEIPLDAPVRSAEDLLAAATI